MHQSAFFWCFVRVLRGSTVYNRQACHQKIAGHKKYQQLLYCRSRDKAKYLENEIYHCYIFQIPGRHPLSKRLPGTIFMVTHIQYQSRRRGSTLLVSKDARLAWRTIRGRTDWQNIFSVPFSCALSGVLNITPQLRSGLSKQGPPPGPHTSSRYCRDASAYWYVHTTTAMHGIRTPPAHPPLLLRRHLYAVRVRSKTCKGSSEK